MSREHRAPDEKPLIWAGSSKRDLLAFPEPVRRGIGSALSVAQFGGTHPKAKPWKGEGGGVFEVAEDHRGNTCRAVYTVRFEAAVYALHAFQKKSPTGIKTARGDVELIARRMEWARRDFEVRYGEKSE